MTARGRRKLAVAALALGSTLVGSARPGLTATKIHLLVIGNNQPPSDIGGDRSERLPQPLQFADDDAAAFYDFMVDIADSGHLLTVLDRDTEASYPQLPAVARAPTMRELEIAIAQLGERMRANQRHGDENVLFVFFSGHGSRDSSGKPALAMLDGGLSQEILYEEILAKLPANYVHVLVDACHAEAVVRPRDTDAEPIKIDDDDARSFLVQSTLARFPHVGAIIASASAAQTHEWDVIRHGVFTYELLSALRGAADVNGDRKIEYSEVYAFLRAANRGVQDSRARVAVLARAPEINRRVPLVDLARFPTGAIARLTGVPGSAGLVELEDGAGRRVASLRGERDFAAELLIPAGTSIYVRSDDKEARFDSERGTVIAFDRLLFHAPQARPRGALSEAMRRGLFATGFGRGFYTGLIDQAAELAAVPFSSDARGEPTVVAARSPATGGVQAGSLAANADGRDESARFFVGGGVSKPVARAFAETAGVRIGVRPRDTSGGTASIDVFRVAGADLVEWKLSATVGWSWPAHFARLDCWWGAAGGAGAVGQAPAMGASRWSGLLTGGPAAGAGTKITRHVDIWVEAQLFGVAYRRDAHTVLSASPAAWIGVSVGR